MAENLACRFSFIERYLTFTAFPKVATYNIVKGHSLLMDIFCYVQKKETSGKHCGEAVKINLGRPRSGTGQIVENCGEAVRIYGRPRSETGHIIENCSETVRILWKTQVRDRAHY